MAKNVFDQIGDIRNNIHRNNFDWSKTNNFTTVFGRITPVYCELCPPNSSLKIKPRFGLRFMPMMFPVQTNMKAYLSFYRVPLRTLWKGFKDWVSSPNDQSSKLEPPYMALHTYQFGEGNTFGVSGLADYLGIPVSAVLPESPWNAENEVSFDTNGQGVTLQYSEYGSVDQVKVTTYKAPIEGAPAMDDRYSNWIPVDLVPEYTSVDPAKSGAYDFVLTFSFTQEETAKTLYENLTQAKVNKPLWLAVSNADGTTSDKTYDILSYMDYNNVYVDGTVVYVYFHGAVPFSNALQSKIYRLFLGGTAGSWLWNANKTAAMTGEKKMQFMPDNIVFDITHICVIHSFISTERISR